VTDRVLRGAAARAAAGSQAPVAGPATRATFRQVFGAGEFRALWAAQLLSIAGDQLARVALTVLVYQRTRSPLLTALTYAVTFLPWLAGGLLLAGLADWLPRRRVMIACDVARMALVCLMVAVSLAGWGAGLVVMAALLFAVTLLDSPFKSARAALVSDILTGEKYVLGTTVTQITIQTGTVVGFAAGGVAVAVLGPRPALLADAVTFGISAVLLLAFVRARPAAAARGEPGGQSGRAAMVAGVKLVFGDRSLRTLMLFGWLIAFYIVPMGLAAPYAARFHGLPLAVSSGLIFAAVPFGTAAGAFAFGRLVPASHRGRWLGPLAVVSCAVLSLCALRPGFYVSLVIFVAAGAAAAYQVAANAAFVASVPAARRGQAFGLANGGMQVLQGAWFVAAGAVAQVVPPADVIALSGSLGALAAVKLTVSLRSGRSQPAPR
jgi:MFS family permease